MLGELSKYQRIKVTPSDTSNLTVSHNLGVVPKIVILSSEIAFTDTNYMSSGIACPDCGAFKSLNASGGTPNAYTIYVGSTGTSNSSAYLNTDSVIIRRATSARYFNTNAEYTVDVYA